MLDLNQIVESEESTVVQPSNNIFERLGNNTYDYKDIISELIDNSIASRRDDLRLVVNVDIYVDERNIPISFVIKDNAKGIPQDKLGIAIAPAGAQSVGSLNEHGLGMKQAVAALGKLHYLATKTLGEGKARLIKEFRFGSLQTFYADLEGDSGTEIAVTDLRAVVTTNATSYTRDIVPYLGARYRRFLKPDRKTMDLTIRIKNEKGIVYEWNVEAIKPIYFHPGTRSNKPSIFRHALVGNGWLAELTFGYAPQPDEYNELGIEIPSKFNPYHVSISKQGLDIVLHDRVILFHQLSEINVITVRHNDYNLIRGEIDLIDGFSTAITKNSMIRDANFLECVEQVRSILQGEAADPDGNKKQYLRIKTYPDQIPEKLLRDRLITWLGNNPLAKRSNIYPEYVIEGVEGYIDILADNEVWELKTGEAKAIDVYQLFMYMDIGDFNKGFLVAPSFSRGARVAIERIREKHSKEIVLSSLDDFPIKHSPSKEERDNYY